MKRSRSLGIACAILAAAIYGFTPIMAKITYMDGSNTISLSFYRSAFSVPILLTVLRANGVSPKVSLPDFRILAGLAVFGAFGTSLMLYGAYNYISVGLTTTIHYIYPVLVAITCVLVFKDKISRTKVISLVLSVAGMLLFLDGDLSLNITGVGLAIGSGIAYAIFLILMDKTGIQRLPSFKISFYTASVGAVLMGTFGIATGQLVFHMTARAWIFTFLMALLVSALANTLVPLAVKHVGATVTAILGMFEPIISVTTGILILKEPYSLQGFMGCGLIIFAVLLLTLEKVPKDTEDSVEEPTAESAGQTDDFRC